MLLRPIKWTHVEGAIESTFMGLSLAVYRENGFYTASVSGAGMRPELSKGFNTQEGAKEYLVHTMLMREINKYMEFNHE